MSTPRGLKQKLATVSRLWDGADYDNALAAVESLREAWPGNAHLHVLWASLVQLQEQPSHDLEEAKQALEQAVELDKGSPEASIELGHFLDNVEDDPEGALKAYAEGAATARRALMAGLIGQARAFRQLDRRDDFRGCLLEILQLARFEAGSKRNKPQEAGADVIIQSSSGDVYAVQLKGPHAEEVQDLLGELARDGSAAGRAAAGRPRD
jgi:tetratricopeptide (TPR) repeat protein